MGLADLNTTIQSEKIYKNDLEAQITNNSQDLRLKQKHSSADSAEVNANYAADAELIRNEMNSLDDKTGAEYEELMAELKELQDDRDRQLTEIEEAATDYQNKIDIENDTLQTQLEAVNADIKGFEEARDQDIEDGFGYFQ